MQPRLWIVRHGETEWSRLGRHTGRTDVPLTETGRAEARALRERLGGHAFGAVLSSPLSRAAETARIAGFGPALVLEPDLAEWDYGRFEGLTRAEIRAERPDWTIWADGAPGGESTADVARRVDRVIDVVRQRAGDTLAFAHGHVLRALAACWVDQPAAFGARLELGTATVSILGWEREVAVIERWNEGGPLP